MNWREWIVNGRIKKAATDDCSSTRPVFREGASVERLNQLENELGHALPTTLRELLSQTDGVDLEMCCDGEWFPFHVLVWTCDEIARENHRLRSDEHVPKTGLDDSIPLYFANVGADGIVLAFLIPKSGGDSEGIYAYYPMEHEWNRVSPSLGTNVLGYDV